MVHSGYWNMDPEAIFRAFLTPKKAKIHRNLCFCDLSKCFTVRLHVNWSPWWSYLRDLCHTKKGQNFSFCLLCKTFLGLQIKGPIGPYFRWYLLETAGPIFITQKPYERLWILDEHRLDHSPWGPLGLIKAYVVKFFCVISGNWSKRRQTETSTNRNVDIPKRRQTKTSTNQNVDKLKPRHTETSTNQNVDKPKRRQTKTSTYRNVNKPKLRQTETSTNRNVDIPKLRQTETSTNQNVDKPKRWQPETSTNQRKPKTVKPTTLTPPVTPQIVTITWTNVGILLIRTSTNRNVDIPKLRQTETSTNQNVDKPDRWLPETSTNQRKPKTVKPTTLTPPVTPQIVTITWTNVGILLIRALETNFKKIFGEMQAFRKRHLKMWL